MIDVIGAPFDLSGKRLGSRLGPAAVRLAGLVEALEEAGCAVTDCGDVPSPGPRTNPGGLRNLPSLIECARSLRREVARSLDGGAIPIVIGGEHTVAVGGISAALDCFGEGLALLWIDAHADVNTPGSSPTGNVHGMPIAALFGLPSESETEQDREWAELLEALGPRRLNPRSTAWYGLRDVDPSERSRLWGLPITMHDIDRRGIEITVRELDRWLRDTGASHLWISFDVDALDPSLAPGTGTAVLGGLTYREAHLLAELLREAIDVPGCPYQLAGVDLVEVNPLYDNHNETGRMTVEWIASLFGKTVLGSVGRMCR